MLIHLGLDYISEFRSRLSVTGQGSQCLFLWNRLSSEWEWHGPQALQQLLIFLIFWDHGRLASQWCFFQVSQRGLPKNSSACSCDSILSILQMRESWEAPAKLTMHFSCPSWRAIPRFMWCFLSYSFSSILICIKHTSPPSSLIADSHRHKFLTFAIKCLFPFSGQSGPLFSLGLPTSIC